MKFQKIFCGGKVQTTEMTETFTPLVDRVANAEAMVLSFMSEHSLSSAKVPHLIALAKGLAHDKKALDSLAMDRTTASYKLTHGLAKTFKDEIVTKLQNNYFSMNIDEATSSNNLKVLPVLVSFFCPDKQKVVIHHLESLSIIKVNSESLFQALSSLFDNLKIPWSNLMSILMDSCNVMRGSKKGLEQLIRKRKAPHLIDIDGDSCFHAHNAAKAFCQPFKGHVESLLTDLHSDFMWSPDYRELLQTICSVLGIKFTNPQRYVPHRWLSVYDVTVDTIRLFEHILFSMKLSYHHLINSYIRMV